MVFWRSMEVAAGWGEGERDILRFCDDGYAREKVYIAKTRLG